MFAQSDPIKRRTLYWEYFVSKKSFKRLCDAFVTLLWHLCDGFQVRGADGSFFPPWISSGDTLEVFVPDLCGTIPLTSNGEEVTYEPGKTLLRFFLCYRHQYHLPSRTPEPGNTVNKWEGSDYRWSIENLAHLSK